VNNQCSRLGAGKVIINVRGSVWTAQKLVNPEEMQPAKRQKIVDELRQLLPYLDVKLPGGSLIHICSLRACSGVEIKVVAGTEEQHFWVASCIENLTLPFRSAVVEPFHNAVVDHIECDFTKFTTLKVMFLACNRLAKLPSGLGKLPQLQYLNVTANPLVCLPQEPGLQFPALQHLILDSCDELGSAAISEFVAPLTTLRKLSLTSCCLQEFPSGILQLTRLKALDLQCNQGIAELPENLGQLIKLSELLLNGCNIVQIPLSIRHLTKLETLRFSENRQLKQLPLALASLPKLVNFDLASRHYHGLMLVPTMRIKRRRNCWLACYFMQALACDTPILEALLAHETNFTLRQTVQQARFRLLGTEK